MLSTERGRWVQSLQNALSIARLSMPHLAIAAEKNGGDLHGFRREKFVTELALLLYAAARAVKVSALDKLIMDLAQELSPHARSELLLVSMRLRPAVATEMATAHVCLTRLGLPDTNFQSELENIFESSVAGMLERVPWKEVQANWLRNIGGPQSQFTFLDPASRSQLGIGLDTFTSRREEVYAFTHSLIYQTDFGRNQSLLPRPALAIIADADAILPGCLDDDDFDLSAEVLLTWPYVCARTWTPVAAFALKVLTRVEDDVGILPALTLRFLDFSGSSNDCKNAYVATEGYHTALVMGLLAAAILSTECGPPASVASESSVGAVQSLLRLIRVKTPRPQWETDFGNLLPREQGSLVPFLAAVGLRRALRSHDFELFRDILNTSVDLGLLSFLPVRHALELFVRLVRTRSKA